MSRDEPSGPIQWAVRPLHRYAEGGRSRRAEFWWFALATTLFDRLTDLLSDLIMKSLGDAADVASTLIDGAAALIALALLVPQVMVTVRRLHDTERSAWWLLLILIPIIGWIVLLVVLVTDGTSGTNRYGPDPKAPAAVDPAIFA